MGSGNFNIQDNVSTNKNDTYRRIIECRQIILATKNINNRKNIYNKTNN